MFSGASVPSQHSGAELHQVITCASRHLFARSHADRYFGGFWFKSFRERGPC